MSAPALPRPQRLHRLGVSGLAAITLGLSACGGGGGGGSAPITAGPAVTISAANYTTVGSESIASVQTGVAGPPSNPILGVQSSADNHALRYVTGRIPAWLQMAVSMPRVVGGATLRDTLPCSSGSMSITFNDTNGNLDLDAAESVSIVFNSCVELGLTLTGSMSFKLNAQPQNFDGLAYPQVLDATVTMNNMALSTATTREAMSGVLVMQVNQTSATDGQQHVSSPGVSMTTVVGSVSRTRTLTNFDASSSMVAGVETDTFTATVSSSVLGGGSAVVTTTTPFVVPAGGTYPTSGAALATGANGGKVVMTALPDGVNLQL
ncbi:MAG: hypothetical protein RL722_360, partial [Pseudomonadota bacterium]